MGLFDYVNFKMKCPKCGELVHNFQTKDTGCELATVEPETATHNFYASCYGCNAWLAFSKDYEPKPHREVPLSFEEVLSLGFNFRITGSDI